MAILMHRSGPDWPGSDLETFAFAGGFAGPGMALRTALVRPASVGSVGSVRLRSADPTEMPLVDPSFLQDESDLDRLAAGVCQALAIVGAAPLSRWATGVDGVSGLRSDMSDAELKAWRRSAAHSFAHMSGACRMGLDADVVVDPELRVHGLTGLRVCDASVMPRVTAGHTQAAVMVIAERCADWVLAARR
ncbi:GMC oxidoreductase [Sphingomonas sp. MMS12-HWE2-04]|uniref:GMC oxidoreductase n=1 Tax=Sphingomonas sp. MMS12-HWE2-04 TaxID=3234199 RepID=UPI00384CABC3